LLTEEVFGPFSSLFKCKDLAELHSVVNHAKVAHFQVVIGRESEIEKHKNLINVLIEKAGRPDC